MIVKNLPGLRTGPQIRPRLAPRSSGKLTSGRLAFFVRNLCLGAMLCFGEMLGVSRPFPAWAGAEPAQMTARDRSDLQRIQGYLNDIKTMSARFEQFTQEGDMAKGRVFMQRPGKMRFEYDPPSPILLIATGEVVIYVDNSLKHVTYLPTESTPAWFLLRDRITLEGDVTVTRFEHENSVLRITVVETAHPDNGSLTLIFSDRPLELKQWTVLDQQGKRVTVTLSEQHSNVPIDPHRFMFVDPWPRSE